MASKQSLGIAVDRRETMTERVDELRDLLSGSDADLAHLDLRLLLDRVRKILDADTAAILLREPGSTELVARVACGLEQEVRYGVRVPLGSGFAGRIAATRQPMILDRIDTTTVTNPILWLSGVRAMLGVPLVVQDELIGVLHVGRLHTAPFSAEDVDLLQGAAERMGGVIHVRRLADEASAAALLERGLLPTRLPALPGIQLAARYVPAEDRVIGGDWYDAFMLPSNTLGLVIGDVAGHGLQSAVVMGRVRSALRAYALLGEPPERVLELTDKKVQHFEIGMMVTLLYATAEPPYERFSICSAGHLPPVLATPGRPSKLVELPVGPPLGAVPAVERHCAQVDTPSGCSLVLYTDGLVERRGAPIDDGLQSLREVTRAENAESVCHTVMHRLVGNQGLDDDVAVLILHRLQHALES